MNDGRAYSLDNKYKEIFSIESDRLGWTVPITNDQVGYYQLAI